MPKLRRMIAVLTLVTATYSILPSVGHAQQEQVKQPSAAATPPARVEDQRGTEQSPVVVKIVPIPKTEAERDEEARERDRIANNERQGEIRR